MQAIDIEKIKKHIADDFSALDQLITETVASSLPLVKTITQHILASGGKRLRPLLILLLANVFNRKNFQECLELAAIIEFVHTATLLHDDVIDHSTLRRGQQTVNQIWGEHAPILIGDFLYSKAFQLLSTRHNPTVMQALSKTTTILAEGEIMQMTNQNTLVSEQDYFDTIYRKTASLFETATQSVSIITKQDAATTRACAELGRHIGLAFQITDDVLDYTASDQSLGKALGEDIKEGKMTLPLIYTYHTAQKPVRTLIEETIKSRKTNPDDIITAIEESGALTQCAQRIDHHIAQARSALDTLPVSECRNQINNILKFISSRTQKFGRSTKHLADHAQ